MTEPARIRNADSLAVGRLIRQYRQRMLTMPTYGPMSQPALAERISVNHTAVSRWECGNRRPTWENMCALSELFGLTPEEEQAFFWTAGFKRPQEDAA
jgi:transcriptional regulator with XRE-family HTH domain